MSYGETVRLAGLDLNLLVALDALLQERSVTRAAERLDLSQPTLSAALARLRRHFDDPLLRRAGNAYQLTPLGSDLAGRTSIALEGVGRLFATQKVADPATSTREFVVTCSDYVAAVAGPALSAVVTRDAPGITVHLRQADITPFLDDHDRLRSLDGVFMPHGLAQGLPHLDLFSDRWVCMVSADNTSVGTRLTLGDLSRMPWVATYRGTSFRTTAMRRLTSLGVDIRAQVTVDNFLTLPFLIAGTGRVAIVQERLARLMAPLTGVRLLDCPFDAGPLVQAMWWHPSYERDAEHRWLRERLRDVARQLAPA